MYSTDGIKKADPTASNIITNKNRTAFPYWWSLTYDGKCIELGINISSRSRCYAKTIINKDVHLFLVAASGKASDMDNMAKKIVSSLKIK